MLICIITTSLIFHNFMLIDFYMLPGTFSAFFGLIAGPLGICASNSKTVSRISCLWKAHIVMVSSFYFVFKIQINKIIILSVCLHGDWCYCWFQFERDDLSRSGCWNCWVRYFYHWALLSEPIWSDWAKMHSIVIFCCDRDIFTNGQVIIKCLLDFISV